MIGVAVAASLGAALVPTLAAIGGSALGGGAIGRRIWHMLARRAQRRVDDLADQVATSAVELVAAGSVCKSRRTLPRAVAI